MSVPASARTNPFDSAFLAELEGLRVLARKVFRGQMRGERRSRNRGQSVEFVDFRPYIKGDDPRRIDWNLYGRLERFYIKLFEEEEDMRLYILLDSSASMGFGNPAKFDYARKLAAGLAYIVLANLETVSVSVFAGDYDVISTPVRGKGKIHPILSRLGALEASGASQLGHAAARFAAQTRKSGIVCIISDFLHSEGISAIAPLLGGGHQLELIQVLSPEEQNPGYTGDMELIDSESGEAVEVSMGLPVLRRYHARLSTLQQELKTFALRGGGAFHIAGTNEPLKEFFTTTLREHRLVR